MIEDYETFEDELSDLEDEKPEAPGRSNKLREQLENTVLAIDSLGRVFVAILGASDLGFLLILSFFHLFIIRFLFSQKKPLCCLAWGCVCDLLFRSLNEISKLTFLNFPDRKNYYVTIHFEDKSYLTTTGVGPVTEWNEEFCLFVFIFQFWFLSFIYIFFSSLVTEMDTDIEIKFFELDSKKKKKKEDVLLATHAVTIKSLADCGVDRQMLEIPITRREKGFSSSFSSLSLSFCLPFLILILRKSC